jgi:hypothetical protein
MIIVRTSPLNGKTREIDLPITLEQLQRWQNGEFIQNVMPHLSADEREYVISGLTKEDFDIMFPPEEDDN